MDMITIIAEADVLVPNDVPVADKVVALNGFNQDFFNVVKIPKIVTFSPVKDQRGYQINNSVTAKNIDFVMAGVVKYHELNSETPHPMQNTYYYINETNTLNLLPSPYQDGLEGFIRYKQIATTTFTIGNLEKSPDAPLEYHWTFIVALASFLANTQDDAIKASNYENQYKAAWNVAAQNYTKEVTQ